MRPRSAVAPVKRVVLAIRGKAIVSLELRRLGSEAQAPSHTEASVAVTSPRRTPSAQVVRVDREVVVRAAAEAVDA